MTPQAHDVMMAIAHGPTACRDFFAGVIQRALDDALGDADTEQEWEQAHSFLADEDGEWAESRKTYCFLLDISPERLRRLYLEMQSDPTAVYGKVKARHGSKLRKLQEFKRQLAFETVTPG